MELEGWVSMVILPISHISTNTVYCTFFNSARELSSKGAKEALINNLDIFSL